MAVQAVLAARGAKVYVTARTPDAITTPGVQVLQLDITDAGIATCQNLVTGDLDQIDREMDTQFFGTLNMVRAFAPILEAHGGGAILNVLSALSWFSYDGANAYAAAYAAEWSLTNGVRLELAAQGTLVTGLHLGAADTDIMAGYDGPMPNPAPFCTQTLPER